MKLIFMGTPEFSVPSLQRLIAGKHEIAAVFTQPDKPAGRGRHLQTPPVKSIALEHGFAVHQPSKIRNNQDVREVFENIAPDACIVVAYGKILPDWLLAIPRLGCINVHASLLPKYRGAAPVNWAIANGERETGITIMQMDVGMDTGPMLATRTLAIGREETAPELSSRLSELGADLLDETLPRIQNEDLIPIPQIDQNATYAPILKREDGLIDWGMNARDIANRVRGFQPWPGTFTDFRGSRFTIWGAGEGSNIDSSNLPAAAPGTILAIGDSGIEIQTGHGSLLLREVQLEGKRRLSAHDFANGARLKVGDRLNQTSA